MESETTIYRYKNSNCKCPKGENSSFEKTCVVTYRFGFNGKMKDDEITGNVGEFYDYGMREYNSIICRFMSVDPLRMKYPELTPYQFASNSPISNIDLDGLEKREAGKFNPVSGWTNAVDGTSRPGSIPNAEIESWQNNNKPKLDNTPAPNLDILPNTVSSDASAAGVVIAPAQKVLESSLKNAKVVSQTLADANKLLKTAGKAASIVGIVGDAVNAKTGATGTAESTLNIVKDVVGAANIYTGVAMFLLDHSKLGEEMKTMMQHADKTSEQNQQRQETEQNQTFIQAAPPEPTR